MLSEKVGIPSFLLLHSTPLCKCTTAFFIHSSTDGHLSYFQNLCIVNYAEMNIGVHIFFWISVSGFQGGSLSQKADPFLIFWGISILLPTVAAPVCIPTNSAKGFPFLHILTNTCFLIYCNSHSDRPKVISHCVFNCISLMISDVEHFFIKILEIIEKS